MNKKNVTIIGVLSMLLLLGVVFFAYKYISVSPSKMEPISSIKPSIPSSTPTNSTTTIYSYFKVTGKLTPSSIIGWNEYTNEVYKFKFSYPNDWHIDESDSGKTYFQMQISKPTPDENIVSSQLISIMFYSPINAGLQYITSHHVTSKTIDEFLREYPTIAQIDHEIVGGENATKIITPEGDAAPSYALLIPHESHLYEIWFNPGTTVDATPLQKQIISTFQFTK